MIGLLTRLRLSLAQYIGLTLAILVGGLVAALKIQGSRLHKAQIGLLLSGLERERDLSAVKVAEAKKRYNDAKSAYRGKGSL